LFFPLFYFTYQYNVSTNPRRKRWAEHVARVGETTGAYRLLVGKREDISPLGIPRYR
jgi:hypothetical protein